MKDIAFALDPDGYWVEILPRRLPDPAGAEAAFGAPLPGPYVTGRPSFQQTMFRIRDPATALPFYERHFGMTLVCKRDFPDAKFSLFFLATLPAGTRLPADPASDEAWKWCTSLSCSTLELTHNHGTESDAAFAGYSNGNVEPHRGFGHIGFLTDNLEPTCAALEAAGVAFTKRPHEGKMRGLAFAKDPDGYLIEIIQRGLDMPATA
jgi:lactoylglutathione lyase